MKELEHDLNLITEECSEIIKNLNKAQRFGLLEESPYDRKTNLQLIQEEVTDLICVIRYIREVHGIVIEMNPTEIQYENKKRKIDTFKIMSKELGKID